VGEDVGAQCLSQKSHPPQLDLHLGRASRTGDGTQPSDSRCDWLDIARAALELFPFEQHLRAGGTEQPVGRAQRIKSGEMTIARDQIDQRSRHRLDARLAGALDLADGAADQQPAASTLGVASGISWRIASRSTALVRPTPIRSTWAVCACRQRGGRGSPPCGGGDKCRGAKTGYRSGMVTFGVTL
jgi:hypothetical protein